MAAPVRVVTGDTAVKGDLNQLIDLLEGAASMTEAFKLVSSTGENFIIKLSDAAGARKLSIQDSAGVEVASIDSDGAGTFTSLSSSGTLVLPTATSPAQTTDGQIIWDSDDDVITIGDGASRKTFYPSTAIPLKQVAKYTAATQTHSATTALVDVIAAGSPATMSFSIAANEVWQARYRMRTTFTGTGGLKFQISGPSAPTAVRISGTRNIVNLEGSGDAVGALLEPFAVVTSFDADIGTGSAAAATNNAYNTTDNNGWVDIDLFVINGSNAGTITLKSAQNNASGTSIHQIGCWMLATKMSA